MSATTLLSPPRTLGPLAADLIVAGEVHHDRHRGGRGGRPSAAGGGRRAERHHGDGLDVELLIELLLLLCLFYLAKLLLSC